MSEANTTECLQRELVMDLSNNSTNLLCPICNKQGTQLFNQHGYSIVECKSCTHRFVGLAASSNHTDLHYGDDYFFGGGAGYSDYLANREIVQGAASRYARIIERVQAETNCNCTSKSMFAIGAAAGFELLAYQDRGWTVCGLEPNASMVKYAKDEFKFDLWNGSLEDYPAAETFDLVTAIQVFAHFRELKQACSKLSQIVKPYGLLLIETWDHRSWTARILGRHWHEYSPPTVLQLFSRSSLKKLLEQFGFELVKMQRPKKYILGKHGKELFKVQTELRHANTISSICGLYGPRSFDH